jgi:protein-S-isoprenylcysteine O-methyltransferase Ste14
MGKKNHILNSIILNVLGGLIVAIIIAAFVAIKKNIDVVSIFILIFSDPIKFLKALYFRYTVPMRFNGFVWIVTFFIYFILDKYDKRHNIDQRRTIREINFKSNTFILYSFFVTLGLIYIKPATLSPKLEITLNSIGIFFTILGFLVLIFGRVEIDGLWGPHIYNYTDPEYKRLVKTGIYSKLRHPIYLGQIILSLATCIIFQSLWMISFPLFVFLINSHRARFEDKHLFEIFGEQYKEYQSNVCKGIF